MSKKALWIAGLLLAAAVVSCGEAVPEEPVSTGEIPASVPAESETEAATGEQDNKGKVVYTVYPEPDISKDLDLSGKTFRVSTTYRVLDAEEGLNGEIINDTVFARNLQVEEHFGITLDFVYTEDWDGALNKIATSGQTEFDLCHGVGSYLCSPVGRGCALDFCDLPYVDFNDGFWFPDLLERFSCYGRLFIAPSDLDYSVLGMVNAVYFNKRILSEYDLESPYQMVYDNRWTLDNFLTMIRQVSRDVNGDGVMDEHDEFGIGAMGGDLMGTFTVLAFGSGLRITELNEDGSLSWAMDGEKIQSIIDRTSEVLHDTSVAIDLSDYHKRIGEDPAVQDSSLFLQGHELLFVSLLRHMQEGFREMEDDFGIVPVPKYDSAQENYYHRANAYSALFAVPSTALDTEKVGAVFSYISWLSNQTVLPAYYEVTLKQKRTRDEDAPYMLDLIHNSISYDFGNYWTEMTTYIAQAYDAGSYERVVGLTMKKLTKALNKLMDKMKNLD